MKISKHEVEVLKHILKKIESERKQQETHIKTRRKAQKKGKTIHKLTQRKKKPVRVNRKVAKKRSSIR